MLPLNHSASASDSPSSSPSGSILDLTLRELLDQLGSSAPAPGGGAAAAVAGGLGAALIEMTANLTLGKPRFADVEDRARAIEQQASALRQQLVELADADSAAFDGVTAAYRLPRADDAQRAERSAAIQAALQAAAAVPLETARLCAAVVHLAGEAAPILNPAVISDVLVGATLGQAGLASAAINVEINVGSMTDRLAADRFSSGLDHAQQGVAQALTEVLATGRSRFPGGASGKS